MGNQPSRSRRRVLKAVGGSVSVGSVVGMAGCQQLLSNSSGSEFSPAKWVRPLDDDDSVVWLRHQSHETFRSKSSKVNSTDYLTLAAYLHPDRWETGVNYREADRSLYFQTERGWGVSVLSGQFEADSVASYLTWNDYSEVRTHDGFSTVAKYSNI